MTHWLGLDLLFIWFAKRFLFWMVRTQVQPETRESLSIDPNQPVCYVLKNESLADYLVMARECVNLGLPDPSKGLTVGRYQHKRASYFLTGKGWVWERKEKALAQPQKLLSMIDELEHNAELDVQLVPVSLFYGRAPARENSIFKILFSDTWRVPGLLRKLLIIMIQGRQTVVHFDEPVSLRTVLNEGLPKERAIRKLGRVFRTHFRRLREAVIGPDLSHRRTMVNALLRMPSVTAAIESETKRSAKGNRRKAEATARSYANEIAADYSHSVIRIYYIVLTWLWNKLYNGVSVNGIDRLKKVATDNEVIYVPCHRSHIDYLLMSYLLFRHGMVPPHIAAGVNLNMPVVGPILRRGGAFFLRRSFKGNRLYTAVFNEYLNMTFDRGFSVEYFIEGGRSRTGRLLAPRPGMLAMTVRSFLRTRRRNFVFVPVHICYEKVLEGGTYLGELYGKEKKQESIFDIFRTLRKIRGTFGRVYVNFGHPIHLNDALSDVTEEWREFPYDDNKPPAWVSQTVDNIGTEIITRINGAAVVNPINLMSITLLSTPKQAMDERALAKQLDFYLDFLRKVPYTELVVVPDISGADIIAYCERMDVLTRQKHALGDVIRLTDDKALLMSYYRNNIIHLFALISLVACLVLNNRRIKRDTLIRQIRQLYVFFQSELFIHWDEQEIPDVVDRSLELLVAHGYLIANETEVWAPDSRATEFMHLSILANTTKHSLERFFIAVEILVKSGSGKLQRAQLENACTMLAQRMSLLHEFSGPEFSDKSLFRNFIQALVKNGVLNINEDGNLTFGDALLRSHEDAHSLLGEDTRQSIQQIADMDLEKEFTEEVKSK
ncbi:MAG: glycerol-3-phosphate 1-O-acyltransferase PlsB [Pseudomonadota bacterium]|nr:glycerol-3-phosphate 1-O-acyltransferase PlsB [Pseudomonadota bacterium]